MSAIRALGSPARRRCEGEGPNDGGGSCYSDNAKGGATAAAAEVVKIADFGVARLGGQEEQMTAETGTYRWMAPEIINHKPYDHRADVFSFAIVLWELATSKVPYDNMTPLQAALGVRQGYRLEIPPSLDPRLSELIGQCWDEDPDLRPIFAKIIVQLEDILQHVEKSSASFNQAPKGGRRRSRGAKSQKKSQPESTEREYVP